MQDAKWFLSENGIMLQDEELGEGWRAARMTKQQTLKALLEVRFS